MTFVNIDKLKKTYTQATEVIHVLKGVKLQLSRGETLAILGQSGSGKSSLLAILAGLDQADSGQVCIAGQNLEQLNQKQLSDFRRENLGIVFQQFHLLKHLTALENVSLPLEIAGIKEAGTKALKALDDVGLSERSSHYPHQLSGGEQQRVAIARAFVGTPPLILADEPSGNLDALTGEHVMNLIFDLAKKRNITMILVTHNPSLAERCTRQTRLVDGTIEEN